MSADPDMLTISIQANSNSDLLSSLTNIATVTVHRLLPFLVAEDVSLLITSDSLPSEALSLLLSAGICVVCV